MYMTQSYGGVGYTILGLVIAVIAYVIFYLIIKAAVRNGTVEAHRLINSSEAVKNIMKICPNCGGSHNKEYNKCPRCGHQYSDEKERS